MDSCHQQHVVTETTWSMISVHQLADVIRRGHSKKLVVDSRSFLEYNTSHIVDAINLSCSKLVRRKLQEGKVSICEMLAQASEAAVDVASGGEWEVYVYDQCTASSSHLSPDSFLLILLSHLAASFSTVRLVAGGFLEFQASHPSLCETSAAFLSTIAPPVGGGGGSKSASMTSLSQPCLPVSNVGPTRILPFLYLGSQQDAMSPETLHQCGITYVLNVSATSPKPPHIPDEHFLRIPVNDTYCERLLPHFHTAFQFLDKVRESGGCALVHCLAGISRSPTLAIAYVMRHMDMTNDEAYKYVKDKRQSISPNFNFLGQLLEYEKQLRHQQQPHDLDLQQQQAAVPFQLPFIKSSRSVPESLAIQALGGTGSSSGFGGEPFKFFAPRKLLAMMTGDPRRMAIVTSSSSVPSPTTALSRLSFGQQPSPVKEESLSQSTTPTTPRLAPPAAPTFSTTNASVPLSSPASSRAASLAATLSPLPLSSSSLVSVTFSRESRMSTVSSTADSNAPNRAISTSMTAVSRRLSCDMSYFPQVPTSHISQINFMPCSTSDKTMFSGAASPSSSFKRDSGGAVKRPSPPHSEVTRSASVSTLSEPPSSTYPGDDVQLRSPEVKAKRPLVRPSSIGIMPTITFMPKDGPTAATTTDTSGLFTQQQQFQVRYAPPPLLHSPSCLPSLNFGEARRRTELSGECSSPAHCPQPMAAGRVLRQLQPCEGVTAACEQTKVMFDELDSSLNAMEQQACISRSLDDIVCTSSPDDAGSPERKRSSGGRGGGKRRCSGKHEAAGGLDIGSSSALGCRGKKDVIHHQSSSSISSSTGSRSSLHGSHEMIEVS